MPTDTGVTLIPLIPTADGAVESEEPKEYYEVTVIRSRSHWEVRKVRVLAPTRDDAHYAVEAMIDEEDDFWDRADQSEGDFDGWEFDDCRLLKVSEANE
jgi:hypothetical protein